MSPEPTSVNFPSSLDSSVTLGGDMRNLVELTLDASINAATGTISVSEDITGINVPCPMLIGSELIWLTEKSGGDFINSVRGTESTTAASHTSGDSAFLVYSANLFNQLKRAILSIEGFLIGSTPSTPYRLSVTVGGSNQLILALKDKNGNDPSATSPVRVQIGDTVRTITSALSVTKNAGTNWCNSGSAELATKEIDYFVYLGYNATDGVVIGFSRIAHGAIYSNFSATATDEKYAAISTITNAAASDAYTVIGRFAATLSAGAGYTWTVPTFTNLNLVHSPIRETRWLSFVPQYSASGSMTYTIATRTIEKYQLIGERKFVEIYGEGETAGTANNTLRATLPFVPMETANATVAQTRDATSGSSVVGGGLYNSTTGANVRKVDATNYGLGTGRLFIWSGSYI